MEARIARLESDVAHIRSDVAEVKADVRALRDRVEAKFDALEGKFDSKFDRLAESLASAKIWALVLYIALAGGVFGTLARLRLDLSSRRYFASTSTM